MKDWNWYSGKDIEFNQQKPIKPRLDPKKTNSSVAVRQFADDLEAYEKEFAEYQDVYKEYRDKLSERYSTFKPDLFEETHCAWMSKAAFDVIFDDAAYDEFHAHRFEEIYNKFWDQVDFIERVMRVMK